MRNIKLVIEYDGTDFVGWQSQANGRSVQDEITKVLGQVLQESVTLIGSGRTDSGVHARGQVANFRSGTALDVATILNALNGLLPDDICVHSVEEVPERFHARYDAQARVYRYYLSTRRSAVDRRFQWFVKYRLDAEAMNAVASEILGEHDFESFCKYDSEVKHYRCTVSKSQWERTPGMFFYEIRANRFLYGMVRALVGTMVDVGRGFMPRSAFAEILAAKDRSKAGTAAPPHGLFLEEVIYDLVRPLPSHA
jgi:tRNA pseudouridine38-40 synthase